MRQCATCREWTSSDHHKCHPVWEVREEAPYDTDWENYHAWDSEEAAEKFAEEYDQCGDYTVIKGTPIIVQVRKPGSDVVERFEIRAEAEPRYYATQLEESKNGV